MEPIISVKNLSKSYKIRHETASYLTLRDILADTLSHPFRFLKKKAKQVAGIDKEETFWALKDVDFSVSAGETLGIIGANGSGKSTLLKILSQITPPTTGEIKIRGKMTSLLEVGTGFHPELTGRENIFLNGAIMGMSKKEISKKFNEIVSFAGVEKFLDTQVKHYSSGMYVRLAFAVAAHMEPDILIIDEVLAVGDAEFQKKCLGKMEEVTQKEGRTILFVSHNLSAVRQLCTKSLLLKDGKMTKIGPTADVVDEYMSGPNNLSSEKKWTNNNPGDEFIKFDSICIKNSDNKKATMFFAEDNLFVEIVYEILKPVKNLHLGFKLKKDGEIVFVSGDIILPRDREIERQVGFHTSKCLIPANLLNNGEYTFSLFCHIPNIKMIADEKDIVKIQMETKHSLSGTNTQPGMIRPILEWNIE